MIHYYFQLLFIDSVKWWSPLGPQFPMQMRWLDSVITKLSSQGRCRVSDDKLRQSRENRRGGQPHCCPVTSSSWVFGLDLCQVSR